MLENGEILARYRLHMETAYMSPESIRTRINVLKKFGAMLGDRPILAATPADVEAFQSSIRRLSPRTVRSYGSNIRQFFRWAQLFDLRLDDPTRRVVLPKVHRGVPRPMPDLDVQMVFAVVTGTLRLIYALAAFAGLRCGEITRLQKRDVNLYADTPVLLVHGKGRRERTVPLIEGLAAELHQPWRESRGWIVVNGYGRPFSSNALSHQANEYLHRELGIPSTLHSLRHWYASNIARITRDPLFVRDLLGHSSVTTTEVYMDTTILGGHERLVEFSQEASRLLQRRHLRIVRDEQS